MDEEEVTTFLIDIYNNLLPKNEFEVIVVDVEKPCSDDFIDPRRDPQENFKSMFSKMPWTAIPFSDIASREHIARKFGVSGWKLYITQSVSLDSKGMILNCNASHLFGFYGTPGYPFSDDRLKFLDSKDDEVAKQPSLESLLGSPKRDYVISNKGDKVPIRTLKDKVVALYFYEDNSTNYKLTEVTQQLKLAYNMLAMNKKYFEVVLLYIYDSYNITLGRTNEESFLKTFKTMPWLALPYKDSNHKKLIRILGYREDHCDPERAPTLVIIGPNVQFVDPCGTDIPMEFGTLAYPFIQKKVAKLETEMTKELKLEMLWNPKTLFRVKKDSSEIPFSQFAGKRLLIYFEMTKHYTYKQQKNIWMMKDLYLRMKDTDDEFEVIYIKDFSSDNLEFLDFDDIDYMPNQHWLLDDYGDLPWSVHNYEGYSLPKELESRVFHSISCSVPKGSRSFLLIAFDRDGSIVRKTFDPTFDVEKFPFYAGGLEMEFLNQLNNCFERHYWCYLDHIIYHRG